MVRGDGHASCRESGPTLQVLAAEELSRVRSWKIVSIRHAQGQEQGDATVHRPIIHGCRLVANPISQPNQPGFSTMSEDIEATPGYPPNE